MNGPAWPLAPTVGQIVSGFVYDGRSWRRTRGAEWSNVQVFTASGRYTPSEDLIYAIVECIGPGGGGGWASGDLDGVTVYSTAAGGGGSGGYSRKTLPAELVIQGVDVIVGNGGLVGVGTIGGGMTAGITNFGGLCMAMGGGDAQAFDGSGNIAGAHGSPGMGAVVGVGDFVMPGSPGGMWTAITVNLVAQHLPGAAPGLGGQLFGGAAWPVPPWIYTSIGGRNGAANTGAGGGGAQVNGGTNTTTYGGQGGTGLCVVTEICGIENGGGPGPEPPGPGRPPGVPINVNAKVALMNVPPGEPWPPRPRKLRR